MCSTSPVNHYTLKFENKLGPLKDSISTIYEFHYQQKIKTGSIDPTTINMIKAPKPNQLYVALLVLHADNNTIETLIEIDESDISLIQSS
jgi:hypothetical protein